MKKVIFYFSGTGNSLRAAQIIAQEIGGARLVPIKNGQSDEPQTLAAAAETVGIVCPVYEWDVPEPVKDFLVRLVVSPRAYVFMVATYIAVHGRCFETVDAALRRKGTALHYGRALRCVASQCIAYEPFPPAKFMVPVSERNAHKIGREIARQKQKRYPAMSPVTRWLYPKIMGPFMAVRPEYDKGFYTSDACTGCQICRRICPCGNITFAEGRPVWNHACEGCNACVVYCPAKAIRFKTPEAYRRLDNLITRRLGLPEGRTRYHNPYVSAADLITSAEDVSS